MSSKNATTTSSRGDTRRYGVARFEFRVVVYGVDTIRLSVRRDVARGCLLW